jgi:hypothetical protein
VSGRRAAGLPLLVAVALGACATGSPCASITIVVAEKDQRTRWRLEPYGLQTSETGYVRQRYREVLATEYWLRDAGGRWHRVSDATWQAAEVGRPAEVCR